MTNVMGESVIQQDTVGVKLTDCGLCAKKTQFSKILAHARPAGHAGKAPAWPALPAAPKVPTLKEFKRRRRGDFSSL